MLPISNSLLQWVQECLRNKLDGQVIKKLFGETIWRGFKCCTRPIVFVLKSSNYRNSVFGNSVFSKQFEPVMTPENIFLSSCVLLSMKRVVKGRILSHTRLLIFSNRIILIAVTEIPIIKWFNPDTATKFQG